MERVVTQGNDSAIYRDIGVHTTLSLNNDGSMTSGTHQDCTPILEHAKAMHNSGFHGSGDMKHAASIPFVIVERYCNDNNLLFSEFMGSQDHKKRLLSDPALSGFRIWKGAL